MRRLAAVVVAVLGAVVPYAAQPSQTAPCDAVATALRSNPKIATGSWEDAIYPSLKADRRAQIEAVDTHDFRMARSGDLERATFIREFNARFKPSEPLTRELDGFVEFALHPAVFSVPGSDLRAVMSVDGTMNCETFLFFRTPADGTAQLADELPRRDAQDRGIFCYTDAGQIGRVAGQPAFIEQMNRPLSNEFALRVVPWRGNRWTDGCTVDVKFKTRFEAWRVYADGNESLKEALTAAAPAIARLVPAAVIPDRDRQSLQRMLALAQDLESDRMPTFGAPVEQYSSSYTGIERGKTYPLLLEGQTYLMLLGHATVGWRDFPETLIILYTLRNDALTPVASAIVKMHRDGIESLRVTPSR